MEIPLSTFRAMEGSCIPGRGGRPRDMLNQNHHHPRPLLPGTKPLRTHKRTDLTSWTSNFWTRTPLHRRSFSEWWVYLLGYRARDSDEQCILRLKRAHKSLKQQREVSAQEWDCYFLRLVRQKIPATQPVEGGSNPGMGIEPSSLHLFEVDRSSPEAAL